MTCSQSPSSTEQEAATRQLRWGALSGVDQVALLLRQASGLGLLCNKGNVVYVHRAPTGK